LTAAPEQDAAAKRRARQTLINLILALGATLAVVAVMVMVTPRDDSNKIKPVDYASVVTDVKQASGLDVPAPQSMPKGWWVNAARFNDQPADGVKTWHIGFVGPKQQYIGLDEGFGANDTWLLQQTTGYAANGDGHPIGRELGLQTFSGNTEKTRGQTLYVYAQVAMGNQQAGSGTAMNYVILGGTGTKAEFAQFANLLGFGFN
jgi:flagellar basal body-associated protein FliL